MTGRYLNRWGKSLLARIYVLPSYCGSMGYYYRGAGCCFINNEVMLPSSSRIWGRCNYQCTPLQCSLCDSVVFVHILQRSPSRNLHLQRITIFASNYITSKRIVNVFSDSQLAKYCIVGSHSMFELGVTLIYSKLLFGTWSVVSAQRYLAVDILWFISTLLVEIIIPWLLASGQWDMWSRIM